MLDVKNLKKNYKQKSVFNNVSFQVKEGEVVGLVGENGAGKSTLLSILATVAKPTNGKIQLDDKSYENDLVDIRKSICYVPQKISIWEEFTVEENMLFFNQLSCKKRTSEECHQLCIDLQLSQWKESVQSLSGGMKRKLNIAISLLHDPKLILLDEPTVGIDLKAKNEIGKYLVDMAKNEEKMILYTSHDMNEIMNFCDRVYTIGTDPFYRNILEENGVSVRTI